MERLSIGNAGWVRWETDDLPNGVLVRFDSVDGRLDPAEIYLHNDRLDARTLREIPLGEITRWVNAPDVCQHVLARMELPGPDLSTLASFYATSFGSRAPDHWVRRSFEAQVRDSGEPIAPPARRYGLAVERRSATSLHRLRVPTSRPYPDEFYARIATAHSEGATRNDIAQATGVPPTTVDRWVKEARRRGLLAPSRRGRGVR